MGTTRHRGPVAEARRLFPDVWGRVRAGGLRGVPVTLAACAGILALQILQHRHATTGWVERLGGVYASLPWWVALLRTPLSLFLPDPELPVWGLVLQVVVVFGIAEATIGPRRTLAVALLATLAGTGLARYCLWAGPRWPLALPHADLLVRDTGPSAAVVGLGVYVALRHRAWWTAGAIVAAMVLEAVSIPNLAGYEHLAGVALILLLAAARAMGRGGGADSLAR
ncbi:hypothetical protein [Streptomyces sp. NPDC021020]|uniref:hypothetical protein n=1 Tax=Streptomyces sp. NPDC021020 TaxID=3365109 RepID=UPI0037A003C0